MDEKVVLHIPKLNKIESHEIRMLTKFHETSKLLVISTVLVVRLNIN